MKQDKIIEKIELYYQQYLDKDAETLCKCTTDDLFSKLFEISFCASILNRLKAKFPYNNDEIENYQKSEIFNLLEEVSVDNEKYLSYCLHWLDYMKDIIHPALGYHSKSNWLFAKKIDSSEQLSLFKKNVIKPIIEYLLLQIKGKDNILFILERYKQRIEIFKNNYIKECVEQNDHPEEAFMTSKELDLHQHLCLYLFDNDINYHYSVKNGNGEMDFLFPQCNNSPYIIEVKVYNNEHDLDRIKAGTLQLKDYMDREGTNYGCLFIYSSANCHFIAADSLNINGIQLVYAYTGNEPPSKRSKKEKVIKIGLGTIE